ncbi:MAG: hypothetical protein Q9227_002097 [Pyrenula ochraceoflavens]
MVCQLKSILTPDKVLDMNHELLETVVGDSQDVINRRRKLNRDIEVLSRGRDECEMQLSKSGRGSQARHPHESPPVYRSTSRHQESPTVPQNSFGSKKLATPEEALGKSGSSGFPHVIVSQDSKSQPQSSSHRDKSRDKSRSGGLKSGPYMGFTVPGPTLPTQSSSSSNVFDSGASTGFGGFGSGASTGFGRSNPENPNPSSAFGTGTKTQNSTKETFGSSHFGNGSSFHSKPSGLFGTAAKTETSTSEKTGGGSAGPSSGNPFSGFSSTQSNTGGLFGAGVRAHSSTPSGSRENTPAFGEKKESPPRSVFGNPNPQTSSRTAASLGTENKNDSPFVTPDPEESSKRSAFGAFGSPRSTKQ